MTLNQIRYFQTIARLEHFRQAALELNISQPSLSRSIAALEEELDIILFERQGRSIRLTKYGRIFLEHVDRILREVDTAKTHIQQLAGNKGHVDVAYVFSLADNYIPNIVNRFLLSRNSDVSFSFYQLHSEELVEGLKKDRFDIIFGSYVDNEPDIQFIPVINQELVLITPQGHPLGEKVSLTLSDLEQYPIIGYNQTSSLGKYTQRLYEAHGIHPNIICASPDEYAISAFVEKGFGIALVADVGAIRQRNICVRSLSDQKLTHTVYLGHRKNQYMIPAVRDFIQFVRREGVAL